MKKSRVDVRPSSSMTRRALLRGGLAAAVVVPFMTLSDLVQAATVYYDAYGNVIVVNPTVIVQPFVVYDVYRRPFTIYPVAPGYVARPVVGPGSVRGVARRTSRRTSRRMHRRHR